MKKQDFTNSTADIFIDKVKEEELIQSINKIKNDVGIETIPSQKKIK